jgi:hypothetical protein
MTAKGPTQKRQGKEEAAGQNSCTKAGALVVRQNHVSRPTIAGGVSRKAMKFSEATVYDAGKLLGRAFHYTKIRVVEFKSLQPTADTLSQIMERLATYLRITNMATGVRPRPERSLTL